MTLVDPVQASPSITAREVFLADPRVYPAELTLHHSLLAVSQGSSAEQWTHLAVSQGSSAAEQRACLVALQGLLDTQEAYPAAPRGLSGTQEAYLVATRGLDTALESSPEKSQVFPAEWELLDIWVPLAEREVRTAAGT